MRAFFVWLPILLLLGERAYSQQSELKLCQNCLPAYFDSLFTADQNLPKAQWFGPHTFNYQFGADSTDSALLFVGDSQYIEVIVNASDTLWAGELQATDKLKQSYARYLLPIHVQKGENRISIHTENKTDEAYFLKPILFKGQKWKEAKLLIFSKNELVRSVHVGILCLLGIMLFYAFFQYFLLRRSIFKVYALYVSSIILFLLLFSDYYFEWHYLKIFLPEDYEAFMLIAQAFIYIFYAEFGVHFLELKSKDPFLVRITRVFQASTLIVVIINAIFLLNSQEKGFYNHYFYVLYFIPLAFSTYMALRIIFRIKDAMKWFIIIGSVLITAGTFIEILGVYVFHHPKARSFYFVPKSGLMDFNYAEIGFVLESMIFLMAIAYKSVRTEKMVRELNEKTIVQLKEKEMLEKQVNELLTEKLKNSDEMLADQKLLNENQRSRTKLMQAQLKSLQLQMNPHYLFNSLNSINDFILSKKPREASEYLALYARMMRNTLRNSETAFNSLEQELQYCEDYLKLEALRFDNNFHFELIRPKELSLLEIRIPSMMLQPVLENAVWHGMMKLERMGEIVLNARESTPNQIVIEITDNGHGLAEKHINERFGLRNIREKIELLEQIYGQKVDFEIMNRKEAQGVRVRLVFPIFRYKLDL
ncbi:histidine kinase [Marinilongibacter aquaticus]|uniref:histidine kinase n=1 Tax=Marinilongibacter aquaticus TaxID=2975157 RepID=UPI0021BD0FE9|nr:histidine kinase [Marinilongibacter aquaticus]UBM59328.1 histidine kinase [Marinilongibacter aquaticus]